MRLIFACICACGNVCVCTFAYCHCITPGPTLFLLKDFPRGGDLLEKQRRKNWSLQPVGANQQEGKPGAFGQGGSHWAGAMLQGGYSYIPVLQMKTLSNLLGRQRGQEVTHVWHREAGWWEWRGLPLRMFLPGLACFFQGTMPSRLGVRSSSPAAALPQAAHPRLIR